ncbi:16438_t:CDS:2 [Rhizophagus irregularis]|nr:16438_t:CDS:2 [Rhizophagus irregularis]
MDTLQSTAYNKIHLNTPNVFVNDKRVVSSEFFSVDATTLRGISAEINDESEQLYELLLNKKDDIDRVLKSQPVYAIGPSFDKNCFSPSITCWVTSCIKPSILEQLEEIFNYEYIAESEFISVSSVAHVGTEDHIQTLDIRTHFHAKIDQIDQKFFINVDVTCGVNEMLSTKWKQLAREGYGYSLESLRIEIAPIASGNYRGALIWEDCLFPREEDATAISDEWKLRIAGTCATGYIWHYELKSDNPKLEFRPGSHICGGRIVSENLCGFRVTVTEILRFKFTSYIPKPSRYRFMKCPKIAHVLEMTFNDLKDFNKKFATLGCHTGDVDEGTFLVSDTSHNKTTTTNSGIVDFERSDD